jgi:hypothetical protein
LAAAGEYVSSFRIDFEDCFSVPCAAGTNIKDVLNRMFHESPAMIRILLDIRNKIVGLFGLKTDAPKSFDAYTIKPKDRLGFLEIEDLSDFFAAVRGDDSHLNFRVELEIKNQQLICKTQVQFNNLLGKVYFYSILPFHKIIVPMMLKSALPAKS